MEMRHLHLEHYEELLTLLNHVFSVAHGAPEDFRDHFPRIFEKPDEFQMNCHLGAFENGRLVGVVAAYPLQYRVGTRTVHLSADGNVAVAEEVRGRGIMSALMEEHRRECTADLSFLHSGNHARYARFGYIECGRQSRESYTPNAKGYTFTPMTAEDIPACQKIAVLMADQIVRRDCDFIPSLRSHKRTPTVIRDASGKLFGFLTHEDGKVQEYALTDCTEMSAVFSSLAAALGHEVQVLVSGYEKVLPGKLSFPALFRIGNPLKMMEIGFDMAPPASDGALTVDSELTGRIHIEVHGGKTVIEPTACAPDIVLNRPHLQLFGMEGKTGNPLFDSWFPLPLYAPYLT